MSLTNRSQATPHRMKYLLLSASLCMLTLSGPYTWSADADSSETIAVALRDKAMRGESVAWDFVKELTIRAGPRPAGSVSEHAAADWAARKLRTLGFENVTIEPFPMTAWVRGNEHVEITVPSPQPLSATALGGAPPTAREGVEGDVVVFASLDELIAAPPTALNGKIAMIARRMVRTQNGEGYGVASAGRRMGPIEAAKRGAIGFLIRSLATGGHRFPHAGATQFADGRVPIPAFAVSEPDADQIERLLQLGSPVRVRVTSGASYVPNAHSQNVVAEVRGSERSTEVVVLGAHLDSWDLATGAIDDGAGTAIITAAAKLIRDAPRKPKRTVRVVLYGSEEVSQPADIPLGNRTYVQNRKSEIGSHVLAGESDFGADRIYAVSLPKGVADNAFGKTLMRVLTPIGVIPSAEAPGRGGSDVAPLAEAGVPTFALHQDGTYYFDYHHTADDTLDKIDPAQLSQNVAAWAALIWLAADSDVDFRALAASTPASAASR
jgi:carboxypeptidase Q